MRGARRACGGALGVFCLSAAIARAGEPVAYSLDATDVASGRVRVTVTLPEPLPAPADLVIPRGYPGGYGLVPYDRFVENVSAATTTGETLPVVRASQGPRWRLGKEGERVARVAYEVDVARMERDLPSGVDASKTRPRYAGLLGYSVFAFVDGLERRPVSLRVRAPDGWPVLSTLAPAVPPPTQPLNVPAPDYASLADSQLLMGPALSVTRLPGTIPLVLAVYAECDEDVALEGTIARTALDRVAAYFGDAPIPAYTVQLELLKPLPGHDYGFSQEHFESGTFSFSVASATTAATTATGRLRTLQNYAHHMAHAWIPIRAYGPGYRPFPWELPPLLDTVWFNEGFGRYASIAALAEGMPAAEGARFRSGALVRLRQILDDAPPFLARMSMRDLSRTASFLYSEDFRVGKSTFARGALMAAGMDDRIREETNGTKSLRDALRALLRTPQPFEPADLPRIFRDATGVDVREIFDRGMR